MKNSQQDKILDLVQTRKIEQPSNKRLKTIFSYLQPACMQNIGQNDEWTKGDPNPETSPTHDFIWIIWILRQKLPKDIVTHFVNLVGGFNFVLQHSMNTKNVKPFKIYLMYWKDDIHHLISTPKRQIYFNMNIQQIKLRKECHYLWYKDGKVYYMEEQNLLKP
jgi:hypothetical protein